MASLTEQAWQERNTYGDLLQKQNDHYKELLYQEGPGEGAKESSPTLTRRAAERLATIKKRLGELRGEIHLAEIERENYWTGPAAKLFGDTIAAYLSFMDELGTRLGEYANINRDMVAQPHEVAQNKFQTHLFDTVYYTWNVVFHGDEWYHKRSSVKSTDGIWILMYWNAFKEYENAFREHRQIYVQTVSTFINKSKSDRDAIVNALTSAYELATPKYRPLPTGPDFSTVTVKKDSNGDGDKDDKNDKSDLDSLLNGDGSGLKDLLGGGTDGLGGGLDGLGGGLDGLGGGLNGVGGGLDGLGSGLDGNDLITGAGGTTGYDVTGNGVPDLSPAGAVLPGSDLPPGSRVVRRADGTQGIDLDGDGVADVDTRGNAVSEGSAPPGSRLVTGPDGVTGYDISGNDVPDLGLDLRPLTSGDLPPGSELVTMPDGTKGIDLNGDGVADMSLDGRALSTMGAASGGKLVTGADGRTGFDMDGDGTPDLGFDGRPMAEAATQSPVPDTFVPSDQVRQVADSSATTNISSGSSSMPTGMGYGYGYPPSMGGFGGMPGGQNNNERERQIWLQEDDEVWAENVAPVTALGRPAEETDDEDAVDEWVAPPKRPRQQRHTPRPGSTARR